MHSHRLHPAWLVVVLITALGLSACPKKAPQPLVRSAPSPSGSSMDESDLEKRVEERVEKEPEGGPLKQIFFAYDSSALSSEARQTLQANADWLASNPDARVEVEGHCDERGSASYNLALGARRAQAAREHLIGLGVASERLSTISYGEELPVCNDANESCWQQNRRGHFQVTNR